MNETKTTPTSKADAEKIADAPKKTQKLFLENFKKTRVDSKEALRIKNELRADLFAWMQAVERQMNRYNAMADDDRSDVKLILPADPMLILREEHGVPFDGDVAGLGFVVGVDEDSVHSVGMIDMNQKMGAFRVATDGDELVIETKMINGHGKGELDWGSVDAPGAPESEGIDKFIFKFDKATNTYAPVELKYGTAGVPRTLEVGLVKLSELTPAELGYIAKSIRSSGERQDVLKEPAVKAFTIAGLLNMTKKIFG